MIVNRSCIVNFNLEVCFVNNAYTQPRKLVTFNMDLILLCVEQYMSVSFDGEWASKIDFGGTGFVILLVTFWHCTYNLIKICLVFVSTVIAYTLGECKLHCFGVMNDRRFFTLLSVDSAVRTNSKPFSKVSYGFESP